MPSGPFDLLLMAELLLELLLLLLLELLLLPSSPMVIVVSCLRDVGHRGFYVLVC